METIFAAHAFATCHMCVCWCVCVRERWGSFFVRSVSSWPWNGPTDMRMRRIKSNSVDAIFAGAAEFCCCWARVCAFVGWFGL